MYNFKQQGNYIYIDHVDGDETINYVGLKKDVKIIPTTEEPTAEIYVYDITTLYEATNSHSSKQLVFDFSEVTIDGVAPTINDFITWVTSNSGNFNSPSSGGTGATLASELTVTPAVNGLTNAQAVLTNHETRIDTLEASSPDLSFLNVAYASTISRAYDNLRPNLEIDITGNLDFTLTGTSSGKSGLLNLYFSGTETATLQGVTDLVVTGAGEMIPVYFVHDSDGLKWYEVGVGEPTVDTSLFALKNGTILFHTIPFTGITSTITTLGTDVTISAGQFPDGRSLGNKITINGESRIITAWLDWNHVTVDSAFTTNYTNEPKLNWDLYSKAVEIDNTATIYFYNRTGFTTSKNDGASSKFSVEEIISPQNTYSLGENGLKFRADRVIRHSNGTSAGDTADIGLRRNSAGIYEVYDGNNPDGLEANRRDLLVRNLTAATIKAGIFTGVNTNEIVTLTYTANVLNWTGLESNLLKIVLTKDSVLANPATPVTNATYQFIVEQDSVGLWTMTYGNKFKFPNGTVPVIDLNANSKGILTAIYDGTHFLVVSAQNFL